MYTSAMSRASLKETVEVKPLKFGTPYLTEVNKIVARRNEKYNLSEAAK
jgi:hypothetical protein